MDDKTLLLKLKNGERETFEILFRKYSPLLTEYATFYTRDIQVSEDIVQDIFYKLWKDRELLKINTSLKAYLYRSIHNNCIQYLRHKTVSQKHNKHLEQRLKEAYIMNRLFIESGINNLFEKEIKALIRECLKKIPEKSRDVFILSRKKNLKHSEIAKKLNLSEKSIEYHISKVLSTLRKELKDYLPLILYFLID